MANFDLTSSFYDAEADVGDITPHFDPCHRRYRRNQGRIDTLHRVMQPRLRSSGFLDGYVNILDPFAENIAAKQKYYQVPTAPCFSGQILPAGVRKVSLCRITNTKTKAAAVLTTTSTDAAGNFTFYGYYPPAPDGEYFISVEGSDTFESKDFLLKSPIDNEYRYGLDPQGNGHITYDTAADLRQLLVEDQFTGIQNGLLNGRTPDTVDSGNAWVATNVQIGGHIDAGNNFVAWTSSTGATAAIETGNSDVLIHFDIVLGNSVFSPLGAGVILRYINSLNFIHVTVQQSNTTKPLLVITQVVGGTPSILKLRPLIGTEALVLDRYYQMKFLAVGQKIWYQINLGSKIWSDYIYGVSTHSNNTMHGFTINPEQFVDNFKVWTV